MFIRRVARNDEQERAAIHRVVEVDATMVLNMVRLRHLSEDQELTRTHTDALQRELAANRSEVRELRQRQATLERRVLETEQGLAEPRA